MKVKGITNGEVDENWEKLKQAMDQAATTGRKEIEEHMVWFAEGWHWNKEHKQECQCWEMEHGN